MYTGYVLTDTISTVYGAGKHMVLVKDPRLLAVVIIPCITFAATGTDVRKAFMAVECFYAAALLCTKLSIIYLYNRIFPLPWFKLALHIIAAFATALAVAAVFTTIFQCVPISSQWDPELSGHCMNYGRSIQILGVMSIVIDFILLVLPIPLVWRIQISKTNKLLITVTFMLGGW